MAMCGKERESCRSQFVDSGYYVKYGAENKLERNYSRQQGAVMRRAQYGTVEALNYSPQQGAARWAPSMALEWIAYIFQNSMNILSPNQKEEKFEKEYEKGIEFAH